MTEYDIVGGKPSPVRGVEVCREKEKNTAALAAEYGKRTASGDEAL
jgi:hypothetical protein